MRSPAPFADLLGARCVAAERKRRYEIPERGAPGHAACVLLPESEAEVGAILRCATEHRLPLVISAGRTGLVEAQRPQGESVLSLEKLNRILEVNAPRQLVTVQAGVSVDALNEALAPHGLFFPMEMGSTSSATVGACVANGSAGANAVCYGTAARMCESAEGYWASGEPAGPFRAAPWATPLPERLAINSAQVAIEDGLIGSQGLFGVITRLTLRLTRLPAQREALLLPAASMSEAMRILDVARKVFGADVEEFEFISRAAMGLVRAMQGAAFRLPFAQEIDPAFYLLLQVKAKAEVDLAAQLYEFAVRDLQLADEQIGYAPLKALKTIRHSISEASTLRMRTRGVPRLSFDTATPLKNFGAYLDALEAAVRARDPAVECISFGHAGVGGAHLHLIGSQDPALVQLVFDVTAAQGGTFSAEHGVGSKWGAEWQRRTSISEVKAVLAEKQKRDPARILNPRSFGMDALA